MANNDKKHDFLLEEYKQAYEQFRHCDNISSSKEAIFAVAAFGVLALVINKDLSFWYIGSAAFVSCFLYLYHVLASRRMHWFAMAAIERIKEIEDKKNDDINNENPIEKNHANIKENICFQTEFEYLENKAKGKNRKKFFSILNMRWILFGLLFLLWVTVIGLKIYETSHASQKHWPRHNQTRHYRPFR